MVNKNENNIVGVTSYILSVKLLRKWTLFRPIIVEVSSTEKITIQPKTIVLNKVNQEKHITISVPINTHIKGDIEIEVHTKYSPIARKTKINVNHLKKGEPIKVRSILWDVEIKMKTSTTAMVQ